MIAIIGILVALLLPAIQAAREAARRTLCTNNLKNLGLAVLNHHDAYKHFPISEGWTNPEQDEKNVSDVAGTGATKRPMSGKGWILATLPQMEEQPLFDQFRSGGAFEGQIGANQCILANAVQPRLELQEKQHLRPGTDEDAAQLPAMPDRRIGAAAFRHPVSVDALSRGNLKLQGRHG